MAERYILAKKLPDDYRLKNAQNPQRIYRSHCPMIHESKVIKEAIRLAAQLKQPFMVYQEVAVIAPPDEESTKPESLQQ